MTTQEYSVGDVVGEFTFTVDPASIQLVTAIVRDPNPIHFDTGYIEERNLPGRVSQGPINASHAIQAALRIAESPTDLHEFSVRYEDFVFEGEEITAIAIVEEKRVGAGSTTVDLSLTLEKPDGTVALTGTASVRIE